MVYCTKCGTLNPDDAKNCSNCGAPLNPPAYSQYKRPRHEEDMCFGGSGYLWGVFIGLFIILIGVSSFLGGNIWDRIWPLFIVLVGIVILLNAFMRRR